MPEKKVTLSSGSETTVRPIRWKQWCRLKERLAALTGSRILSLIQRRAGERATATDLLRLMQSEPAMILPDLMQEVTGLIDDLSEEFVIGCCDGLDVQDLSASDFAALREAALEVSDVPGLLRSEKNLFGGLAAKLLETTGGPAESAPPGDLDANR